MSERDKANQTLSFPLIINENMGERLLLFKIVARRRNCVSGELIL